MSEAMIFDNWALLFALIDLPKEKKASVSKIGIPFILLTDFVAATLFASLFYAIHTIICDFHLLFFSFHFRFSFRFSLSFLIHRTVAIKRKYE